MMRKTLVFSAVLALIPILSRAQVTEDLRSLVDIVVELREEGSDKAVYDKLAASDLWTLMDEIESSEGECSRSRRRSLPHFGLNDMAYAIAAGDYGVYSSAGHFCDGTDPRYNYSFIEKTIRAGVTATYIIRGRTGKQTFVIVPFEEGASLEAALDCGGVISRAASVEGNLVINADAGQGSELNLSVTNPSGSDAAYVIVNYNSRKN